MILLKNCLIALCTLLVVTTAAHAQSQSPTNVVVDGNSGNKSETSIVVDPNNPEHLMATWNDFTNGTTSKPGWAFSTDGGTSWYTKGTITPSTTYSYGFDPSCAIGRDGNEYYAYVATPSSGSHGPVDVSVSTNDGQSWHTQQVSASSSDHDKPYIAVDTTTGNDSGNVYVAYQSSYIQQNDPNNPDIYIMLSTSPAGGSNWTRAVVDDVDVNSSQDNTINMADPSVGPHGTVYVAHYVGTGTSDGPAEIRVAKSTSGGANFKVIYTFSISGAYQNYYGLASGVFNPHHCGRSNQR